MSRDKHTKLSDIFRRAESKECRLCKSELDDGRRNWCGPKCKRIAFTVKYALNWKQVRSKVLDRDNYECQICGSAEDLHVDHIIPVSKNGPMYDEENLQTLCSDCNLSKSDKTELDASNPTTGFESVSRRIDFSEYKPYWI